MLFRLIQSLYYPAVVGTCFYVTLLRLASRPAPLLLDLPLYFALITIAFFSLSYLMNHFVGASRYTVKHFSIDLLEVGCIYLAFSGLGLLDEAPSAPSYSHFYASIIPVPVLQQAWNVFSGYNEKSHWFLAVAALLVLGMGYAWGYRHASFNILAVLLTLGITIEYGRQMRAMSTTASE